MGGDVVEGGLVVEWLAAGPADHESHRRRLRSAIVATRLSTAHAIVRSAPTTATVATVTGAGH